MRSKISSKLLAFTLAIAMVICSVQVGDIFSKAEEESSSASEEALMAAEDAPAAEEPAGAEETPLVVESQNSGEGTSGETQESAPLLDVDTQPTEGSAPETKESAPEESKAEESVAEEVNISAEVAPESATDAGTAPAGTDATSSDTSTTESAVKEESTTETQTVTEEESVSESEIVTDKESEEESAKVETAAETELKSDTEEESLEAEAESEGNETPAFFSMRGFSARAAAHQIQITWVDASGKDLISEYKPESVDVELKDDNGTVLETVTVTGEIDAENWIGEYTAAGVTDAGLFELSLYTTKAQADNVQYTIISAVVEDGTVQIKVQLNELQNVVDETVDVYGYMQNIPSNYSGQIESIIRALSASLYADGILVAQGQEVEYGGKTVWNNLPKYREGSSELIEYKVVFTNKDGRKWETTVKQLKIMDGVESWVCSASYTGANVKQTVTVKLTWSGYTDLKDTIIPIMIYANGNYCGTVKMYTNVGYSKYIIFEDKDGASTSYDTFYTSSCSYTNYWDASAEYGNGYCQLGISVPAEDGVDNEYQLIVGEFEGKERMSVSVSKAPGDDLYYVDIEEQLQNSLKQKIDLNVIKTWSDDSETVRPDKVKYQILANEEVYQEAELTGNKTDDEWSDSFELPVYDEEGNWIQYEVVEGELEKYKLINVESDLSGDSSSVAAYSYSSTSKYLLTEGTTEAITISYRYQGILLPEDFNTSPEFIIKANGSEYKRIVMGSTTDEELSIMYSSNTGSGEYNSGTLEGTILNCTIENLPMVDEDGNPIEYTVEYLSGGHAFEDNMSMTTGDNEFIFIFDPFITTIYASKEWADSVTERPDYLRFVLCADGKEIDAVAVPTKGSDAKRTVILNTSQYSSLGEYSYGQSPYKVVYKNGCYWYHLPAYYKDSGEKIHYEVKETVPAGYVQKELSVNSSKNYAAYGSAAVGASSLEYKYSMKNQSVEDALTVKAIWEDSDGVLGVRPDSVTVNLLKNGKVADTQELSEANDWSYSWEELLSGNSAEKNVYSVEEVAPDYYSVSNVTLENGNTEFVNTCGSQDYSVKILWQDDENADDLRPEDTWLVLYENGSAQKEPVRVSEENSWSHTWPNLPKYKNNQSISYTVKQLEIPLGYTESILDTEGISAEITNTHATETSLTVQKIWDDSEDADGIRPETIKVQLYAGGGKKGSEVTLSAENNWSYTWESLPTTGNGKAIEYTVKETEIPEGYAASRKELSDGTILLVNTHEVEKTNKVKILWEDKTSNKYLSYYMPEELTVYLYDADGRKEGEVTVTGENTSFVWEEQYTASNVAEAVLQESALYDVKEAVISGVEYTVDSSVLENGDVEVKIALVQDHFSGTKPKMTIKASVNANLTAKAELYADGKLVSTKSGRNIVSWENMPMYQDNSLKLIDYYVVFYGSNGEICRTTTEKLKLWNNALWILTLNACCEQNKIDQQLSVLVDHTSDINDALPAYINVYGNGKVVGTVKAVYEKNKWKMQYTDTEGIVTELDVFAYVHTGGSYYWSEGRASLSLPSVDADGNAISYYLGVSDFAGKGKVSFLVDGFYVYFSGRTEEENVPLKISKTWDDGNNISERPEKVVYYVYANGELYETVEVTAADIWSKTVLFPRKDAEGNEIIYDIVEKETAGYVLGNVTRNMRTTAALGGSYYDLRMYYSSISRLAKTSTVNSIGTITISIEPQSGKLYPLSYLTMKENANYILKANGEVYKNITYGQITDSELIFSSNGTCTIKNVPFTDSNGNRIQYEVEYVKQGYEWEESCSISSKISTDSEGKETWEYTLIFGPFITNIFTAKEWLDQDSERMDQIVFILSADGKEADRAMIPTKDSDSPLMKTTNSSFPLWRLGYDVGSSIRRIVSVNKCVWYGLPVYYRDTGKKINYGIEEILSEEYINVSTRTGSVVSGFLAQGFTLTNQATYTSRTVQKVWDDADDAEGKRPSAIQVQLLADSYVMDTQILSKDTDWEYTWEHLPVYENGKELNYTVKEVTTPEGYEASVESLDDNTIQITNSYASETSCTVKKEWKDRNNKAGKRPDSVTVQLLADDAICGDPITLNEENDWKYTWDELPKYKNSQEIIYTVKELNVPDGYGASVKVLLTGTIELTNTYEPVTKHTVEKKWEDVFNIYKTRPDSIEVQLYADGTAYGDPVTVSKDSGWSYTWENLPNYNDNDEQIVYTADEVKVPSGYYKVSAVTKDTKTTITNHYNKEDEPPSDPPSNPPSTPPSDPPGTTVTAPPAGTKSPKTGAALPVAGLMVSISAVVLAIVGKKRKDK